MSLGMESPRCNGVGFRVKSAACWRSWVTFNVGLVPALEAKFRVGRTQLKSSVIFGNVIRIGICFYFSWRTRSTTGPQLCLLVEHEPRFFEKNWLESGFTWRLNGNWPWVSVHFQKNWTRTGFEFQNQNQNLFVSRTIFSLLTKGEYGIEHDEYFLMTETLNFTIQRKYDTVPTIDVQHKIICKRSNWEWKKKREKIIYISQNCWRLKTIEITITNAQTTQTQDVFCIFKP